LAELTFTSKLTWSGGRLSRGLVEAGGEMFQFSVPAAMGGPGRGNQPGGAAAERSGLLLHRDPGRDPRGGAVAGGGAQR